MDIKVELKDDIVFIDGYSFTREQVKFGIPFMNLEWTEFVSNFDKLFGFDTSYDNDVMVLVLLQKYLRTVYGDIV